jgi:hypothetical protein
MHIAIVYNLVSTLQVSIQVHVSNFCFWEIGSPHFQHQVIFLVINLREILKFCPL